MDEGDVDSIKSTYEALIADGMADGDAVARALQMVADDIGAVRQSIERQITESGRSLPKASIAVIERVAEAVQSGEAAQIVKQVAEAVAGAQEPASGQTQTEPAVPVDQSVGPDYIVNLDDGRKYKQMARVLAQRGETPDQYRARWGLPADYPMVAGQYTSERAAVAKGDRESLLASRRAPAQIKAAFDKVLASPAKRSNWAAEVGKTLGGGTPIDQAQLDGLISEALKDGRLKKTKAGGIVRTAKAKATGQLTGQDVAPGPATTAAMTGQTTGQEAARATLDRPTEVRATAAKNDIARRYGIELAEASNTEAVTEIIDRLKAEKKGTLPALSEIVKILTGTASKAKSKAAVYAQIETAVGKRLAKPEKPATPSVMDLVEETKRRAAFAEQAVRDELAKPNPRLSAERNGVTRVLTRAPGGDGFRITSLRDGEPIGHRDYTSDDASIKQAAQEMVSGGMRPPAPAITTEASGQTSLVPEVTDRDRLKVAADKALTGGNAPADFGLFGSSSQQLDLVEMSRAGATESAKVAVKREPKPVSLIAFLRARGGINDDGGDLRAMEAHKRPGLVNYRNGLTLDHAREIAAEAGYLKDTGEGLAQTSTADLLEAIREELSGRPTYSTADASRVADMRDELAAEIADAQRSNYVDQLSAWHEENGLSFRMSDREIDRAADLMSEGQDIESAVEAAFIEAVEDEIQPGTASEGSRTVAEESLIISFDDGAVATGGDGAEGGRVRPAGGQAAPEAEGVGASAADRNAGLERDWRDGPPQDGLGQADVSAAAGRDGESTGTGGEGSLAQGSADGGIGVSDGDAPALGAGGDRAVQGGASGDAGRAAGRGERAGSGDIGEPGVPAGRAPAKAVGQTAASASPIVQAIEAQRVADATVPYIANDPENIRASLPLLKPAQRDDVVKAEARFAKPDGFGYLFTNGTGTGKTFTGLGVVKRFVKQGKNNVLILAPSQGILDGWVASGRMIGLDITRLPDTGTAGEGIVATTYANLRENPALATRQWDLLVADEAHNLSQNASGAPSEALSAFRGLTNHSPAMRASMMLKPFLDEITTAEAGNKAFDSDQFGDTKAMREEYARRFNVLVDQYKTEPRAKALFLSATPFAYRKNTDWAEGFLFSYPETKGRYNDPGGQAEFLVRNFGYNMRYNRAEEPGPEVNVGVLEREFYERLKREGVLSGRRLEVEADYDRRFVLVDDAVGAKIDQAMNWLSTEANGRYYPLAEKFREKFNYLAQRRLLEAIKAKHAIPRIKEDLALGRKVVVFHDYNEGGGLDAFAAPDNPNERVRAPYGEKAPTIGELYYEFVRANPYVKKLNFAQFKSPIETLTAAFPEAMVYNGRVPNKQRARARDEFNRDGSGRDIIIVQSAAGEAGISLHDTTGKHQRVLYNLGLPTRPTTAIQQEGRIYREGQVSDAILRYMSTGTGWERTAFAQTIAERASTAENLALGDEARALRDAFIDAFNEADEIKPSADEGKGGKQRDRTMGGSVTPWDRAKAFYFAEGKKRGRRDQREGTDYFATPEPIGLKMVEFADVMIGERILEPSAGHGAIARWFPEGANRFVIEPSASLASRAGLASPGAKVIAGRFEDHYVGNKYDAIVMNPPFGVGGKDAFDHVQKAVTHLRDGGRVVAIVPRGGMADRRWDSFRDNDANKNIYTAMEIELPPVMFERAGTKVATRMIVLEKHSSPDSAPNTLYRDLSDAETINELFDRIEGLSLKPRVRPGQTAERQPAVLPAAARPEIAAPVPAPTEADETPAVAEASPETVAPAAETVAPVKAAGPSVKFKLAEAVHGKTGKDLFVASIAQFVPRPTYEALRDVAKKHGGYYSTFRGSGAVPGFQFASEASRTAFLQEVAAPPEAAPQPIPETDEGRVTPALPDSAVNAVDVARVTAAYKFIARQVRAGKRVPISEDVTNALLDAAWPHTSLVPEGAQVAALAAVRPPDDAEKRVAPWADSVGEFKSLDGGTIATPLRLANLPDYRAGFDRRSGAILFFGLNRASIDGVTETVMRSRIAHEAVHAVWKSLGRGVKSRLVRHANTLGVLDMQLGTVLRAIGEPVAGTPQEQETLRDLYEQQYANASDLDDRMAQESVAHLRELAAAGFFMEAELSTIAGDMALLDGVQEGKAPPSQPEPLRAAIQASQDRLGLARHFGATRIEDIGPSDPHPGRVLAFHGTDRDLEGGRFDPEFSSDFGVHFGTAEQANQRSTPGSSLDVADSGGRNFAALLDLQSVIDLPDLGQWDALETARAIERVRPDLVGLASRVAAASNHPSTPVEAADDAIRGALTAARIDGIRYRNSTEGSGWSYIVWEPGHVISATSGETLFAVGGGNPDVFDWGVSATSGSRETVFGDTTVTYGVNPKTKYAQLILVETPKAKRGQGSARAALEQFVAEADRHGYTLSLTADPMDKGVSKTGLVKFYKSLGFVPNKGRNKDFAVMAGMIRQPKPSGPMFAIGGGIPDLDLGPSLLERLNAIGDNPRALPPLEGDAIGLGFTTDTDARARYEMAKAESESIRASFSPGTRRFLLSHPTRNILSAIDSAENSKLATPDERAAAAEIKPRIADIKKMIEAGRERERTLKSLEADDRAQRLARAAAEPRPIDPAMEVYHGTNSSFDRYSGEIARAKSDAAKDAEIDVMWVTPLREFASNFGPPRTLMLEAGFYFDPWNDRDLARLAPFINKQKNAARIWARLDDVEGNTWGVLESADTLKELQRLGYDGVNMREEFYDAKDKKRVAPTIAVFGKNKVFDRERGSMMFAIGGGVPDDLDKLTAGETPATIKIMTRDELAASIAAKLREAIDAEDGYYYGLRVTEQPLTVGEIAAPSKQWYADFVSEDDPFAGREAYPDHDTDLDGSSAIGVETLADIELALATAGVAKSAKKKVGGRYGHGHYSGEYVSIIRSDRVVEGSDPGEWIMSDAEVVATWPFPPSDKVEAGLNRNNSLRDAARTGSSDIMFAIGGGVPDDANSTFPSGLESKVDRVGSSEMYYSRVRNTESEVYIESIETKRDRGQGNARKLLEDIAARADAEGITLVLDADPQDDATDATKLRAFYESVGFRHAPGEDKSATYLMKRAPKPTPAVNGGSRQPTITKEEMRSVRAKLENEHAMSTAAVMDSDPYHPFMDMAGALPDDVNAEFMVHGLSATPGGGIDADLLQLLETGIDRSRPWHAGPPKGGTYGINSTRSNAPYLILSDRGGSFDDGIKHVVLNGPAEALKAKLSAAYPNVNFMTVTEADQFMRTGAVPPKMTASVGARLPTPPGIANPAPAADEEGSAPSLNAVIQKLKDSVGAIPTQTLMGVTIKAEDGAQVRLNPRRNVRGQTRSATGAIGVRKSRAIDVIAHEMAHYLETTLGAEILDLQRAHATELETFQPGATPSEQFADWFSYYVLNEGGTETLTPALHSAFEDVIEANAPEMLEGLHDAREMYRDWIKRSSPEALASDVVSTYAGNSWTELATGDRSLSETVVGKMAGAYTAVIDDLAPVQQMVRRLLGVADSNGVKDEAGRPISLKMAENPYKIARMFRGSYATGYSWLKNGIANRGETSVTFPGLAKALETLFGTSDQKSWDHGMYQAAGNYLIAQRAVAEYDRLDQKAARIAAYDDVLSRGAIARQTTADVRDKARATLERREAALVRAEALARDRSNALKSAEAQVRRIQERIQDKKEDVLAAQMARDEALVSRRQRDLANLERQSQAALGAAASIRDEYETLSTEVALLNAELPQRREQAALAETRIASIDQAVANITRERKMVAERGASRPPTRESREHWLDVIAKTEADPKYARIQEFAKLVHEFSHGLLTLRHQAGLVSTDQYVELTKRKDWYVPFQRDMSDASPETVFGGGATKKWSPFKKFDGSDRAIINPLETLASDAYATAQQIAFNDAAGALASLAERAGPGAASIAHVLTREEAVEINEATFDRVRDIALGMGIDAADADRIVHQMEQSFAGTEMSLTWSPATKGPVSQPQIPLWRGGERTYVRFADTEFGTEVFNALSGMGKETASWLTEFFATPARLLQMGITTHPTFMPRNLFRDIFDAWIKTGALPVATQVKGVRAMRDKEFMRRYYEAGGIVGGRNVAALTSQEQQAKVLDLGEGRISRGSIVLGAIGGGLLGTLYGGPIGGLAGAAIGGYALRRGEVLKAVEAVETMTRVGVASYAYKRAIEHNPALTESEAMLEAAFVARDVFDWNRRGSKMVGMVRTVTFMNAQIQGMDAAFRKLAGESDRGNMLAKHLGMVWRRENGATLSADEERQLGDAYKTWARMGIYTMGLLSLYALATSGGDDDDKKYQDVKDKTKATHSWLPNVFGVDLRLPKAFEWALPANVIESLADGIRGRDPRVWDRVVDSTYEIMAPPLVPQAANLIVGLAANTQLENLAPWVKRLLGRDPENVSNRQIVGDQLARLDPESQFDAFTTQLSIDIAKGMAAAGVPRDLIPSPKKIDFILRSGGYWGQDIAKGYGILREGAGFRPREAPRVTDIPVVAGFTGVAARQSKSRDEMFQLMAQSGGRLATAAATYKQLIDEEGTPADAERFLSRLEPEERVYTLLKYYGTPSAIKDHPLERLLSVDRVLSKIRKDMILDRLTPVAKQGRKTVRDFEEKITLSPRKQTEVHEIIERLQQAEAWNSMVLMKRPGWEGKGEIAVKPIMDELKASSSKVFELYEERLQAARVHDFADIKTDWPETRGRILREGVGAF